MNFKQKRLAAFLQANPDIAAELKAEKIEACFEMARYWVKGLFVVHRGNTDAVKADLRSFDFTGISDKLRVEVVEVINETYQWYISSPSRMLLVRKQSNTQP